MGKSESVLAPGNRTPHQPVLTGPAKRRRRQWCESVQLQLWLRSNSWCIPSSLRHNEGLGFFWFVLFCFVFFRFRDFWAFKQRRDNQHQWAYGGLAGLLITWPFQQIWLLTLASCNIPSRSHFRRVVTAALSALKPERRRGERTPFFPVKHLKTILIATDVFI